MREEEEFYPTFIFPLPEQGHHLHRIRILGAAGEGNAWARTEEDLHQPLHQLQLGTATCDRVNYTFSQFTNKQLKDTCFCFCQYISRKTGNESDWNNKPWEETPWNFSVLHLLFFFSLKWQKLRHIDLYHIKISIDNIIAIQSSVKENKLGSFPLLWRMTGYFPQFRVLRIFRWIVDKWNSSDPHLSALTDKTLAKIRKNGVLPNKHQCQSTVNAQFLSSLATQ